MPTELEPLLSASEREQVSEQLQSNRHYQRMLVFWKRLGAAIQSLLNILCRLSIKNEPIETALKSYMDELPTEVHEMILDNLPIDELERLRESRHDLGRLGKALVLSIAEYEKLKKEEQHTILDTIQPCLTSIEQVPVKRAIYQQHLKGWPRKRLDKLAISAVSPFQSSVRHTPIIIGARLAHVDSERTVVRDLVRHRTIYRLRMPFQQVRSMTMTDNVVATIKDQTLHLHHFALRQDKERALPFAVRPGMAGSCEMFAFVESGPRPRIGFSHWDIDSVQQTAPLGLADAYGVGFKNDRLYFLMFRAGYFRIWKAGGWKKGFRLSGNIVDMPANQDVFISMTSAGPNSRVTICSGSITLATLILDKHFDLKEQFNGLIGAWKNTRYYTEGDSIYIRPLRQLAGSRPASILTKGQENCYHLVNNDTWMVVQAEHWLYIYTFDPTVEAARSMRVVENEEGEVVVKCCGVSGQGKSLSTVQR